MPVGSPSKQTVATKKYEQKAGWVSKSYKLKRDLTEQFAEACDKAGVSQAAQLTKMMKNFSCRKDVEKEYIAQKELLIEPLLAIGNVISDMKKIQSQIAEEELRDRIDEIIFELYKAKEDGVKAVKTLYDKYNEIYQKTEE